MITTVIVRERGTTPRNLAKAMTAGKRQAWRATAEQFHLKLRLKRFTKAHGQEAGYYKRKGEGMTPGSKQFKRSYTGRKLARFGHTDPLVFSGEAKRASAAASITSTATAGKASYASLRKLNFRHPKSKINMALEFRRLVPSDLPVLSNTFDRVLDDALLSNRASYTTKH